MYCRRIGPAYDRIAEEYADTFVLEKLSAGGQMAQTYQIDNYPGFEDGVDDFSLAEKMQKQEERFGAKNNMPRSADWI